MIDCVAALKVLEMQGRSGLVTRGVALTNWPVVPWSEDKRYHRIGDLVFHDVAGGIEAVGMRMFSQNFGWNRDMAFETPDSKIHVFPPM